MRAIDLYSGVGGWSLGLRLAGIEVAASYEMWGTANETNFKNNHHQAQTVDIRRLDLADLPSDIDVVVGSPPCTQFSFSNRGGNGDIDDGLIDVRKFLTIVDHVRPSVWVMENVPRVAGILEVELRPNGALSDFAHLDVSIHVLNMEDFGLPQRRRRCFAGNFDHRLLQSYQGGLRRLTLGQVLSALEGDVVTDPLYGMSIGRNELHDHQPEDFLNHEEERINRASKQSHPIYNAMPFPDPRNKSVRTITATCTRVSRESIVIDDPEHSGKYRRLTVRERASLQGFPITFQFFGRNYAQKLKMIGNAVPPAFTYLLGHALQGTEASDLPPLAAGAASLTTTAQSPPLTVPDRTGRQYKPDRTFRFAIPNLRLKSGVRFEFANRNACERTEWLVRFVFGTSKDIRQIALSRALLDHIRTVLPASLRAQVDEELAGLSRAIEAADVHRMQQVWSRQGPGLTRPFMMLDTLDLVARRVIDVLTEHEADAHKVVGSAIAMHDTHSASSTVGHLKLFRHAPLVASGLLVGSCANHCFSERVGRSTLDTARTGSGG